MMSPRTAVLLAHAVAGVELALAVVTIATRPVAAVEAFAFLVSVLSTLVVGWLLAWKRPQNPLGWMLLGFSAVFTAQAPIQMAADALLTSAPMLAAWLLWLGS